MANTYELMVGAIERFEGNVEHLYKDHRGNVTVGIGILVSDQEAAKSLPFVERSTGKTASPDQIAAEFSRVYRMASGNISHRYYAQGSQLVLPDNFRKLKAKEHLKMVEDSLVKRIDGFQQLSNSVQMVLIDMAYQAGIAGLTGNKGKGGYPKMLAAIKRGDWETAAAESTMRGANAARAGWRVRTLLNQKGNRRQP
ncbi:MAG: hypothetical protein KA479_09625 [Saprospiraceae bacterium]|nr:hypothetical protein [Saprospiraceae bacterium]